MKERVISVDERDSKVWALITDVPRLKSPWQYVCFVLNVIIPGNLHPSHPTLRQRHHDYLLLLRKVEQNLVHDRSFPVVLGLHTNRVDLLHLLGDFNR